MKVFKRGYNRRQQARHALIAAVMASFFPGVFLFCLPALFVSYWKTAIPASDTQLGWVTTLAVLASGFFTYLAGLARSRWGTRMMYVVSLVLMVSSLVIAITFPTSLWAAYVWAFIAGASTTFAYSPSLSAVQEWYPTRLGLTTGLINISFGLSAALASPIVARSLTHFGFTTTNAILITLMTVTMIVSIILSTPRRHEKARVAELSDDGISQPVRRSMTTNEALHSSPFWQIWLMWFAGGASAVTMLTFSATYSDYLNGHGVFVNTVAVVTAFAAGNGIIRLINAVIIDRVGPVIIDTIAFGALSLGYLALILTDNGHILTLVAFLGGSALGSIFTTSPSLITPIFGLKHFGQIFGLIFAAYGIFGALAGPLASTRLSSVIGYKPVFAYLAALSTLACLMVLALARTRKKM
ncbi:MAG: MFS transporter [Actinomycetaceae bacterium]|nr:MFS transporter [Actinomycetaceae bacterium]MDY6083428.1 MFS transporter [Actinomycetaceae bacterium]